MSRYPILVGLRAIVAAGLLLSPFAFGGAAPRAASAAEPPGLRVISSEPGALLIELTVDVVFPLVYGLFFSLAIGLVYQRSFAPASAMQRFIAVPFLATLCDYLENVGIVLMLLFYPQELGAVALLVRPLTLLKWLFTIISAVLLLVGLGALLARRRVAPPPSGG